MAPRSPKGSRTASDFSATAHEMTKNNDKTNQGLPEKLHLMVISQDVRGHGGVSSYVWSVIEALEDHEFSTELATIATSWRDEASLRLVSPKSWKRRVRSVSVTQQISGVTRSWTHYGGIFVEFGWLRYQPRKPLNARLKKADGLVVVCGTAQFAAVARNVNVQTVICAATTLNDERGASALSSRFVKRSLTALWSTTDRRLELASLRNCNAVVTLSKTSADLLEKLCQRSVIVAPMGYPNPEPRNEQTHGARDRVHFLAVGRIDDPRKRVDVLLEAYRLLRLEHPKAPKLVIATGSAPTKATLRQIKELSLSRHVRIEVEVTDERLRYLYLNAYALLHSADQEGLGLVVLEAMSAGIPVVCTRCGGPEDILRNGVDGLLVERGSPKEICDAALWILNNPEAAAQMGRSGAFSARNKWHPRVGRQIFQSVVSEIFGTSTGRNTDAVE
jgi:glycosyltransferase involved in cell wall biosynthesis